MENPNFIEAEKRQIREKIITLSHLLESNPNASRKQKEQWTNEIANLEDRLTWNSNPDRDV
ncbi:hypothetical protein [uncultured Microscilla sp.]|uniref:hypothetical protein n=1 Tax=uncultured Microscilla sp. TaxID=432653 RepID=UPI00260422CF|nr:hypothetical protein [uncultured Microscilla sp.]